VSGSRIRGRREAGRLVGSILGWIFLVQGGLSRGCCGDRAPSYNWSSAWPSPADCASPTVNIPGLWLSASGPRVGGAAGEFATDCADRRRRPGHCAVQRGPPDESGRARMSGSDGSRDQLGRALRLSCNHRIHSAAALVLRHGLSVRAATHPCAGIPALRLCVRRSRLARLVQNLGAAETWVRASRGQQAAVGCACFRNAKAAFDVPTMSTGTVPKVSWRNPPNPCNASTAARNAFACSSLIGIRLPRFVDSAENLLKNNTR